jgi:hypothetical protein
MNFSSGLNSGQKEVKVVEFRAITKGRQPIVRLLNTKLISSQV